MHDLSKPVPGLLLDLKDNEQFQELVTNISELLAEGVSFGTHIVSWHNDSGLGQSKPYHLKAKYLLANHMAEQLDATSHLVRAGSCNPCAVLIRTILEAYLCIKYLYADDTDRRCKAYMVCDIHEKISLYTRMDPKSDEGKKLNKTKKDMEINVPNAVTPERAREAIKTLKALLSSDELNQTEAAWQVAKKKRSKPKWFSLYGGPKELYSLACGLNLGVWYELYRLFSADVHAQLDTLGGDLPVPDGTYAVRPIRYPVGINSVAVMVLPMISDAYHTIIKADFPNKEVEFSEWYVKQISPQLKSLMKDDLIKVTFGNKSVRSTYE